MSRYDDDDSNETKTIKGKVISVKKNKSYESQNGKEYRAHLLIIETSNGDERKYKISTKSKAADFVKDLEEGEKVTIKKGGKYDSVLAVYKDDGKSGDRYAKSNSRFGKSDPTGAIQGMVLKAAIDIARTSPPCDRKITEEDIIEAAKLVLSAKNKVDSLVIKALKPKDEDDSDDVEDSDEEDDSDDEKPRKKARKKESDDDDSENIPY